MGTDGRLTGTVFGNQITGFWNEATRTVTFFREPPGATPNYGAVQVYTGYLFQNPRVPVGSENVTLTLAGSFVALAGSGGTAQRTVYGWYAQISLLS